MDRTEFIYKMKQMQEVNQAHAVELLDLEHKMQKLEDYVHLVMRGPKGDRGADCDLTEEAIKNAVRKGVVEGLKELEEDRKPLDARGL